MNITSFRIIQGVSQKANAPTAAMRGTVESVGSCIDVSTWPRLINALTTMAAARIGALTTKAASSVRRVSSVTSVIGIGSPASSFSCHYCRSLVSPGPSLGYEKLFNSEPTTRFQPSATTKSRIFSGVEMITGGNCSIPTDVVTAATTMSTTMNGR